MTSRLIRFVIALDFFSTRRYTVRGINFLEENDYESFGKRTF